MVNVLGALAAARLQEFPVSQSRANEVAQVAQLEPADRITLSAAARECEKGRYTICPELAHRGQAIPPSSIAACARNSPESFPIGFLCFSTRLRTVCAQSEA